MSLVTDPKLDDTGTGSPDDHAHYALKKEIARAAVEGGLITALCGVKFAPVRNPERYPTCQACAVLLEQYGARDAN